MLRAALQNGLLDGIGAILTGYAPTPEHAEFCRSWIERIKAINPRAIYLCDPIIGDEPSGLYVREAAARAIRDRLMPLSDIATPNAFELQWLSGRAVADPAGAVSAARSLGRPTVVATSAPANAPDMLANMCVKSGGEVSVTQSPRKIVHAHGTGDFFASLFLAHKLNGFVASAALRAATAAIDAVLERSAGRSELALIETQEIWAAKEPALAALAPS